MDWKVQISSLTETEGSVTSGCCCGCDPFKFSTNEYEVLFGSLIMITGLDSVGDTYNTESTLSKRGYRERVLR